MNSIANQKKSGITRISVPKASDILADQLRDLILNGTLRLGDYLPSERDLVVESNLSRSTVRDSLRLLEVEGLITTRPGRSGGSIVQLPNRKTITQPIELFVKSHEIQLESLLDCRLTLEPFLAARAATNRTEEELAEIILLNEAFNNTGDDISEYTQLNLEWHLAVARAAHNELLLGIMEAIAKPILEAANYQMVTTSKIRAAAKLAHMKVLEAIKSQDSDLAHLRMTQHIGAYIKVSDKLTTEDRLKKK